jgi:predicted homoserine dehydrogenase-like protein
MRNLTQERQLAFLNRQKQLALAPIGKSETVVVAVAKRDKAGNEVLDSDGVPVIVDKRVLKRGYIESEHNDRIAKFVASGTID